MRVARSAVLHNKYLLSNPGRVGTMDHGHVWAVLQYPDQYLKVANNPAHACCLHSSNKGHEMQQVCFSHEHYNSS